MISPQHDFVWTGIFGSTVLILSNLSNTEYIQTLYFKIQSVITACAVM
jgi:hypothetical protein